MIPVCWLDVLRRETEHERPQGECSGRRTKAEGQAQALRKAKNEKRGGFIESTESSVKASNAESQIIPQSVRCCRRTDDLASAWLYLKGSEGSEEQPVGDVARSLGHEEREWVATRHEGHDLGERGSCCAEGDERSMNTEPDPKRADGVHSIQSKRDQERINSQKQDGMDSGQTTGNMKLWASCTSALEWESLETSRNKHAKWKKPRDKK
ncbi:hypothetical protein C8R45DRAFT_941648 [Mycena sanguinolenta]|nr:hypothetical protein C8R45DRAFT_941648 [Mycena sanguinolenta]